MRRSAFIQLLFLAPTVAHFLVVVPVLLSDAFLKVDPDSEPVEDIDEARVYTGA